MIDYSIELKKRREEKIQKALEELYWNDPPAFYQLEDYTKSSFRKPDLRVQKKLINLGILEPDGSLSLEICRLLCKAYDERINLVLLN